MDAVACKSLSIFLLLFSLQTAKCSPRLNPRRGSSCKQWDRLQQQLPVCTDWHRKAAPTDLCEHRAGWLGKQAAHLQLPASPGFINRKDNNPKGGGCFPSQLHSLEEKTLATGCVRKQQVHLEHKLPPFPGVLKKILEMEEDLDLGEITTPNTTLVSGNSFRRISCGDSVICSPVSIPFAWHLLVTAHGGKTLGEGGFWSDAEQPCLCWGGSLAGKRWTLPAVPLSFVVQQTNR